MSCLNSLDGLMRQFWKLIIFCHGLVMIIYGLEAISTMGGKYWEMWYFARENGSWVFKPNFMPKKYTIAIVPITGLLVCVAAIASVIEDSLRLMSGSYTHTADIDSPVSD